MKNYNVKVYSPEGAFLKNVPENFLQSRISFTSVINGGQGELQLDLALNPFDMPSWISPFNFVRVYEFEPAFPDGRLIYTGYISQRVPFSDGTRQGIRIICLGLISLLNNAVYKDSPTDWIVTKTGEEPADIIKDIIDQYQSVYPPASGTEWIGYDAVPGVRTGGQIDDTGKSSDFTFDTRRWIEAINDVRGLSGANWNFFVDAGGDVIFKEKPASATHTFTFQKDVQTLEVPDSIEEIINNVVVDYGSGTQTASDASSISSFGQRDLFVTEQTSAATAQDIADQRIASGKDIRKNATITINDNYDIESIKPGDTCKIQNLEFGSTITGDNMLIVSVNYDQFTASIDLETRITLATETDRLIEARK